MLQRQPHNLEELKSLPISEECKKELLKGYREAGIEIPPLCVHYCLMRFFGRSLEYIMRATGQGGGIPIKHLCVYLRECGCIIEVKRRPTALRYPALLITDDGKGLAHCELAEDEDNFYDPYDGSLNPAPSGKIKAAIFIDLPY